MKSRVKYVGIIGILEMEENSGDSIVLYRALPGVEVTEAEAKLISYHLIEAVIRQHFHGNERSDERNTRKKQEDLLKPGAAKRRTLLKDDDDE